MPYLAQGSEVDNPSNKLTNDADDGYNEQGGYSCSVRSVTQWEDYRSGYILEHPNYWSRYMDRKIEGDFEIYSNWTGMEWPPVHWKSHRLEWKGGTLGPNQGQVTYNDESQAAARVTMKTVNMDGKDVFYTYTDQGYRRDGDWTLMGNNWTKGTCIMEFNRVCPDTPEKAFDLEADSRGADGRVAHNLLFVQDTDISFRPRIVYDNVKAHASGRWFQEGGECVDQVVRGCFNNGTCVGPNQCECAEGWSGDDCSVPVCSQTCHHNGNCTLPDTCTCEKGWDGYDCSIAVCAQEVRKTRETRCCVRFSKLTPPPPPPPPPSPSPQCNNFGECVAPDTCKCKQWPNTFYDGFEGGGRPIFRKPNGDAQMTGWTGYDCSVPICVQSEKFTLNINRTTQEDMLVMLGGHGKDGKLVCEDVRCHDYNLMVTQNDGTSFQTGCGFDPIDTGCCDAIDRDIDVDENGNPLYGELVRFICHQCKPENLERTAHNVTCNGMVVNSIRYDRLDQIASNFRWSPDPKITLSDPKMCGRNHNPGGMLGVDAGGNPTNVEYYKSYLAGVGPE
jgi:hypothetical protein